MAAARGRARGAIRMRLQRVRSGPKATKMARSPARPSHARNAASSAAGLAHPFPLDSSHGVSHREHSISN